MLIKPHKKFWNAGAGPWGAASGGGGGTLAFIAGQNAAVVSNGYSSGTKSVPNQNGGVPFTGRVFVGFVNNDSTDPATFKFGSTVLTRIAGASGDKVALWWADVVAETDTVSFTNGNGYFMYGVACAFFTGASTNPSSPQTEVFGSGGTDPQSLSASVAVPSGGMGIILGGSSNGATGVAGAAPIWANCTNSAGDVNAATTSAGRISMAHTTASGAWAPTASATVAHDLDSNWGMAACSVNT